MKNLKPKRKKTVIASSKGNLGLDAIFVVVGLFVLGIVMVFMYGLYTEFNDDIQADDDISAEAKATSASIETNYPQVFDQMFALFLVVLWIALIVTTYLIDTNPAFFVIVFIMLVITFIIGMELSNEYEEFTSEDDLSASAANFPMTNWIMGHFLEIVIVMVISGVITLYAKQQVD